MSVPPIRRPPLPMTQGQGWAIIIMLAIITINIVIADLVILGLLAELSEAQDGYVVPE